MISREEARVILKEMHDSMHDGYITHLAYGGKQDVTMESDIEALSVAIEALSTERPKGRWEVIGKTENGANILQCSNCKRIRRGSVKSAFCRDCGCDMRGEEE